MSEVMANGHLFHQQNNNNNSGKKKKGGGKQVITYDIPTPPGEKKGKPF